jgi:uncharacterized protein
LAMDNNLLIIKETIRQVFPECQVYLFGSRARQEHSADSDYDILVLISKEMQPLEKLPFRTRIRKMLLQKGIFSDILLQSFKEADVKKEIPGHIIRNAMLEGSLI